jgi:hypothetical protein
MIETCKLGRIDPYTYLADPPLELGRRTRSPATRRLTFTEDVKPPGQGGRNTAYVVNKMSLEVPSLAGPAQCLKGGHDF